MTRQRIRDTGALLIAATIALSGCGSTVQQTSTGTTNQNLGDPTFTSGGGATGASGTTGTAPGGSGTTSGTGPAGGTSSTGGGAAGTGGSAGTSGAAGSGTTGVPSTGGARNTKPISVGVVMIDFSKLAATFGVTADSGDIFRGYKRMIDYTNRHGGLAGRRIAPIYYSIDGASANQASAVAAACAYFTQDHKVDVVLSFDVGNVQGFAECINKKGIPQLDGGQYAWDATSSAKTPNLFTPDALAHDRFAATLMKVAVGRSWITSKDVLGVLTQDCPVDNRVYDRVIVPAAKRAGIKVLRATTNCINGNADIATAASQINNAVLRFRSEGVTHVTLAGAPEGAAVLLFGQAASQQRYYPTYLLTSNAFAYNNSTEGTWPSDQLAKMKGIGWSPLLDVGPQAKATGRTAEGQRACKTMDPTLANASSSNQPGVVAIAFYGMCDTLRLLGAALAASNGAISVPVLTGAYGKVAASVASARTPNGTFSAAGGRRDGAALAAPFSFKPTGCRCMSYDGGFTAT